MKSDAELRRLQVRVTGRVQGVAFRWHTQRQALTLGLSGWVRNEPDGSVRVLAEGRAGALDAFLDWLAVGPEHARVDHREVRWSEAEGFVGEFRITG